MDGLIDKGCDCDSGKEHEDRMEGGDGELIEAADGGTIFPFTNLNNIILELER